jgi:hypothetical protein
MKDHMPYIADLLLDEPWRAGQPDAPSSCHGAFLGDGSEHWLCLGCGRVGMGVKGRHAPVLHPDKVAKRFFRELAAAAGQRLMQDFSRASLA